MNITLSRRLAKVMSSESMLEITSKERYDFVNKVSKYDVFEDLPVEIKTLILAVEKTQ